MIITLIIIANIVLRLLPHPPNSTPMTASALFGGRYLQKRYALIIPLVSIVLSDYLLLYINPFNWPYLNFSTIHPISALFHSTTLYVWAGFIFSGLIGLWLHHHPGIKYTLLASLLSSFQFFIITNFGVWAAGYYEPTIKGLLQSYVMGIPFYRWTLLGDLFYTTIFFGGFYLARQIITYFEAQIQS